MASNSGHALRQDILRGVPADLPIRVLACLARAEVSPMKRAIAIVLICASWNSKASLSFSAPVCCEMRKGCGIQSCWRGTLPAL